MTALIRSGSYVAEAHANWGRWVASCWCRGGELLQRFQPYMECSECGTITEIIWPSEDMVYGVERLLIMRPAPSTRNWFPNETLTDLMRENAEHGIFDQFQIDTPPGTAMLVVEDGRIRSDSLPVLKHRVRKAIA